MAVLHRVFDDPAEAGLVENAMVDDEAEDLLTLAIWRSAFPLPRAGDCTWCQDLAEEEFPVHLDRRNHAIMSTRMLKTGLFN
jgi:hypothetical protein